MELRWENSYCKDRECSDCKADRILALIKEAGYRQLPQGEPPVLTEEEMYKILGITPGEGIHLRGTLFDKLAQAARDAAVKFYTAKEE